MIKIFKRYYHPGFSLSKKLCLPLCPNKVSSVYYKPVYGNEIQSFQLKNVNIGYSGNNINFFSNEISKFYNNNVLYIPTSHNTPLRTAFKSLRNIKSDKYLKHIDEIINKQHIDRIFVDNNGVFINNEYNRIQLLSLINYTETKRELNIVKNAIYGIFSNFGDSIYIANDYLQVGNNNVIIANYPDKVSEREIERCRTVAYSLLNGNYPIILDNETVFEGEANIKFIPAMIYENSKYYQLCFSYNSSRSSTKCIKNINKYLDKLKLPLLKEIKLMPQKNMKNYFYHLDCIMNFEVSNKYQYFTSISDFWKNYKRDGTVVVEMNGMGRKTKTKNKFDKIFENIVNVSIEDDLLCANMLLMNDGYIGSSKLSNKSELDKLNKTLYFNHPSIGGGGAHKCCSNVMDKNKEISIEEWSDYLNNYNINVSQSFIQGVKEEIERLKKTYKNIYD
jgi:hypothetical protein